MQQLSSVPYFLHMHVYKYVIAIILIIAIIQNNVSPIRPCVIAHVMLVSKLFYILVKLQNLIFHDYNIAKKY